LNYKEKYRLFHVAGRAYAAAQYHPSQNRQAVDPACEIFSLARYFKDLGV
jgi:hypothetical protein